MFMYYIQGGQNSFLMKDEIKKLKPTNKHFKKWWKFNYEFNAWELEVANVFHTKKFENSIREFCKENKLQCEILEDPIAVMKSIKDFDTPEEFFKYFHQENRRYC